MCKFVCHNVYLDIEAQKYTSISSHDCSSSSSTGEFQDTISQPVIEFGKTMSDLTEILQSADRSLKRMLVAFENMAHYMKSTKYIAIVQSKEYEAVNSVRALFQLLAPHWKPVDCSLLKALVEAAGVEEARKRLDAYIFSSNSLPLGNGSEKIYVPHTLSQTDHDSTSDVISSQPVDDSTSVPVTTVVAANKMSWGTFRRIQSLLCGVFRVPSFALQYDENEQGSVVIKCITSLEMRSHIESTLLDDSDMHLLLCEKIISIQIGNDNTIAVGTQEYCIVSNTPKATIEDPKTPEVIINLHSKVELPLHGRTETSPVPLFSGHMAQLQEGPQKGHTFGHRQPPLYVTIQKILDKYPDGQIFKVHFTSSFLYRVYS